MASQVIATKHCVPRKSFADGLESALPGVPSPRARGVDRVWTAAMRGITFAGA
jgi:hypothetical protein